MDLAHLKRVLFGTSTQPELSESTLFKVIFWPDQFLLWAFLVSTILTVALLLVSRKTRLLEKQPSLTLVSAVFLAKVLCFLTMIGSASATARLFIFIFGGDGGSQGNQAAVTIFSILFSIPALFCASVFLASSGAMYFLLGLKPKATPKK